MKTNFLFIALLGILCCSGTTKKQNSKFGGVQIGTITYSYRELPNQSLEATLDYAVKSGLSSVELMGYTVESYAGIPAENKKEWRATVSMDKFKEVKKMFKDKGVKINILKLETFGSPEEIDYAFRVCKTLGAIGITTEVSYDVAKRVAPFAEKHKLYLILHNHCQSGDPNFSYDPILEVSKAVKLNFDAGHYFGVTGKNPCDFIRQYHSRIASLHLKDKTGPTTADACGVNKPWGQGETPIKEILQLLKKEKYPIEADIELEYKVPGGSDPVREVAKCVEYCREALK
ncbi:MAG: sugar phosphate isomerase/epimerase [Tannerella sp.]|jgi:sugar phosphate isomerase/epimerase|nr:sugar phosphate isomerase/epimerase [Tannerella sp.]